MKELSNYITEKLDINKVNLAPSEFPIKDSIESIASYLESLKFKRIKMKKDSIEFNDYANAFYKQHGKSFIINTKNNWIRFANTSVEKIGKNNPIFVIKGNSFPRTLAIETYIFWENYLSEEDFLEKIEETFNV